LISIKASWKLGVLRTLDLAIGQAATEGCLVAHRRDRVANTPGGPDSLSNLLFRTGSDLEKGMNVQRKYAGVDLPYEGRGLALLAKFLTTK